MDHLPGFVLAQAAFNISAGGGEPGGSGSRAIRPRRIDARRLERIGKVRGQIVETETYMVSPNGRTSGAYAPADRQVAIHVAVERKVRGFPVLAATKLIDRGHDAILQVLAR